MGSLQRKEAAFCFVECDLGLIFKIADDTGAEFVGGNCEVDFLYMNSREPAVELDVQKEIVSGDAFSVRQRSMSLATVKLCFTGRNFSAMCFK